MTKIILTCLAALVWALGPPGAAAAQSGRSGSQPLFIAVGPTAEEMVLGFLLKALLAGPGRERPVEVLALPDRLAARRAVINGLAGMYLDYTAQTPDEYLGQGARDARVSFEQVARLDRDRHGLVWLKPFAVDGSQAVLMLGRVASRLGITTISELAAYSLKNKDEAKLGVQTWPSGDVHPAAGLNQAYGPAWPPDSLLKMDQDLVYPALAEKRILAGIGRATDGRLNKYGLTALQDDRGFFIPDRPAVVAGGLPAGGSDWIKEAVAKLAARLTTAGMVELDHQMAVDGAPPEQAARNWLAAQGLK